jgi:hypothetical protein
MFAGRNIVIATKHQKEKVIAPILEKELGLNSILLPKLDTDLLGTFTGEIQRKDDPITTAKNKCLIAFEMSDCDIAIASEGSFGMHPSVYFIPVNEEVLYFWDKKNDIEISAKFLSTETNFSGEEIFSEKELEIFCKQAQFPSHGLIITNKKNNPKEIVKGIENVEFLKETFQYFMATYGKVYIETDMRAMYNPSRMKVIEQATQVLIENINNCCPACSTPGFSLTHLKRGLPCEICNFPTQSIMSHTYTCKKCTFAEIHEFPLGKEKEDPMYCNHCNP